MNDLLRFVAEGACREHGAPDIFNGANFSFVLCRVTGLRGPIDGILVRAMLTGRDDVEVMGGGHYRLLDKAKGGG